MKLVMFGAKVWEQTFQQFWAPRLTNPSEDYADLLFLVSIRMILPLNTACCERGFSKMKLIKTYLRNRLHDTTLSALMMISINGPALSDKKAVHDLCYAAYMKWITLKKRTSQRSSLKARKKQHYRGKPIRSRREDVSTLGCTVVSGMLDDAYYTVEDDLEVGQDAGAVNVDEQGESDNEADTAEDIAEEWCTDVMEAPEGWLLQGTAPATLTHASLKKTAKIAHRFKNSWCVGKYKYICSTGENKGLKAVYYSDDKLLYFHSLSLDEYGPDGMWCILKKEPKNK